MSFIYGQNGDYECGMTDTIPSHNQNGNRNHCFSVEEIQESCTKVWVRMNFHFFLDDNCEGTLDPLGNESIPIEDAYQIAEDLIEEANYELGDGHWQQTAQTPFFGITEVQPVQCVPFRYALNGVYIHCNTEAYNKSGSQVSWFRNNYGVNVSTEFNGFFVEYIGGPNGAADGIPGTSFTSEKFTSRIVNHEMGHVLDLYHTFYYDVCEDTPLIRYKVDYNCDGDTDDYWLDNDPDGYDEREWVTQSYCPTIVQYCPHPGPIDYDDDGIIDYEDPCDPDLIASGCLPHPECTWDFVTNNIMAYGVAPRKLPAFSECQITRMLDFLSTEDGCEYIEVITDDICLPPIANLHILPNESVDDDCRYCFQIQASVHDEYYQLDFYDEDNELVHSTGFRDGPANEYCISRSMKYEHLYNYGFESGENYTAILTVENHCGEEASESIDFILPQLPSGGCQTAVGDFELEVFPNPFISGITVDYTINTPGTVRFFLIPIQGSGNNILLEEEVHQDAGTYEKTLSITQVTPGSYYFVLELNGKIEGKSLIRL